ncbi:hypothetical protein [Paenochrobactrum sp. BZR 201-1]
MKKFRPFIIKHKFIFNGEEKTFLSRVYRKGLDFSSRLHDVETTAFWKTCTYNRFIGISFSVGAFLFGFASILMFCSLKWGWLSNLTNLIFFAGSIPFTLAAGLQHIQSANFSPTPDHNNNRFKLIGWSPANAGWLSTFTQLLGTLAFNISTFNAIAPPLKAMLSVLEIWTPNFEGSVLFLISGYLAFIEVDNRYWSWKPKDISWQAVFVNLFGCIAFMISAVAPQTPEDDKTNWIWLYSNTYTLIGAICFFIAAQLLIRESKQASPD